MTALLGAAVAAAAAVAVATARIWDYLGVVQEVVAHHLDPPAFHELTSKILLHPPASTQGGNTSQSNRQSHINTKFSAADEKEVLACKV